MSCFNVYLILFTPLVPLYCLILWHIFLISNVPLGLDLESSLVVSYTSFKAIGLYLSPTPPSPIKCTKKVLIRFGTLYYEIITVYTIGKFQELNFIL